MDNKRLYENLDNLKSGEDMEEAAKCELCDKPLTAQDKEFGNGLCASCAKDVDDREQSWAQDESTLASSVREMVSHASLFEGKFDLPLRWLGELQNHVLAARDGYASEAERRMTKDLWRMMVKALLTMNAGGGQLASMSSTISRLTDRLAANVLGKEEASKLLDELDALEKWLKAMNRGVGEGCDGMTWQRAKTIATKQGADDPDALAAHIQKQAKGESKVTENSGEDALSDELRAKVAEREKLTKKPHDKYTDADKRRAEELDKRIFTLRKALRDIDLRRESTVTEDEQPAKPKKDYPPDYCGTGTWKMTMAQWKNIHKDYKGKRADGTRSALTMVPGHGTCSVPVEIIKESTSHRMGEQEIRDANIALRNRHGKQCGNLRVGQHVGYQSKPLTVLDCHALGGKAFAYVLVGLHGDIYDGVPEGELHPRALPNNPVQIPEPGKVKLQASPLESTADGQVGADDLQARILAAAKAAQGGEVDINDLARRPEFRAHYKRIQQAVKQLVKAGKVSFEGFHLVKYLGEKKLTEALPIDKAGIMKIFRIIGADTLGKQFVEEPEERPAIAVAFGTIAQHRLGPEKGSRAIDALMKFSDLPISDEARAKGLRFAKRWIASETPSQKK